MDIFCWNTKKHQFWLIQYSNLCKLSLKVLTVNHQCSLTSRPVRVRIHVRITTHTQ
jgi:hypothetical protein